MFLKLFFILIFVANITVAWTKGPLYVIYDKKTELYGFKDKNNQIIILPQFENVFAPNDQPLFSDKSGEFAFLVPVYKKGQFWRMTVNGALKFQSVFFDNGPDYYEEGLTRFIKDGKIGFHDQAGNIIIAPKYDFASPFRDGYANVCNGCWAEYPKNPTYLPLSSRSCKIKREDMYENLAGGQWGLIDRKGNVIIDVKYDYSSKEFEEKLKSIIAKTRKK